MCNSRNDAMALVVRRLRPVPQQVFAGVPSDQPTLGHGSARIQPTAALCNIYISHGVFYCSLAVWAMYGMLHTSSTTVDVPRATQHTRTYIHTAHDTDKPDTHTPTLRTRTDREA